MRPTTTRFLAFRGYDRRYRPPVPEGEPCRCACRHALARLESRPSQGTPRTQPPMAEDAREGKHQ
jgi:hypothetical protein